MRKIALLILVTLLSPSVFAAYTLTSDDQKLVDLFVQKTQTKSVRNKESIISVLKNAQVGATDERRLALFQAIEGKLRKKDGTQSLATKGEREEIKKALLADSKELAQSATVGFSGKLTNTVDASTISFDTQIAVDADMRDMSNPKVRLQFQGKGSVDAESASVTAESRIVNKQFFLLLSQLDIVSSSGSDMSAYIAPYIGTWYVIPLDNFETLDTASALSQPSSEEQALQKEILSTNLIPNLYYQGQTNDVSTYSGYIDKAVLVALIKKAAIEQEPSVPQEALAEFEKALKSMTFFATFTLDKKGTFTGFKMVTTLKNVVSGESIINGSVTVDSQTSPFSGTITAPANAKNFDAL